VWLEVRIIRYPFFSSSSFDRSAGHTRTGTDDRIDIATMSDGFTDSLFVRMDRERGVTHFVRRRSA
jgi:hypothetical protein